MSPAPGTWYQSRKWARRRRHQLMISPLCVMCQAQGKIEVAIVADHIQSHRNNWTLFLTAPLQSLCKKHHDEKTEGERRAIAGRLERGCDALGWPLDKRHWAYIERE